MKTIIIDGIQYNLVPSVVESTLLICTLDGVEYYLGSEAPIKMNWYDAVKWCKTLGPSFELPSRLVLLACFYNPKIKSFFSLSEYWSSTEIYAEAEAAWQQNFERGAQEDPINKRNLKCVYAVRRREIDE